MKALVVIAPNQILFKDVDIPIFDRDQVLVEVKYSMMCSSDVKLIKGQFHGLKYPIIPGHEWSGKVVDATPNHKHLIDKKVVVDILSPCLTCEQCRRGRRNLCANLNEIGINLNGGYAEYIAVNVKNVIPISDDISYKDACIIEPLAVVYNAIQKVCVKPAEKVTILGAGAIGLILISLMKLSGATEILVSDYIPERLEKAKKLGATKIINAGQQSLTKIIQDNRDIMPDVVFDATGSSEAFGIALEIIKPGGRIGYIGYSAYDKISIQPSLIMLKELKIFGVLSPTETWLQSVSLMEKKMIAVSELITHEYSIEQYQNLFSIMSEKSDGIIRGVFKF